MWFQGQSPNLKQLEVLSWSVSARPASARAPWSQHKSAASRAKVIPLSVRTFYEMQLDVRVGEKRLEVLRQNGSPASAAALRQRSVRVPCKEPPCLAKDTQQDATLFNGANMNMTRTFPSFTCSVSSTSCKVLAGGTSSSTGTRTPIFCNKRALRIALRIGQPLLAARVKQGCPVNGLRTRTLRNTSHS